MLRPRPRCRAIAWPGQPSRWSAQTCRYRASRRSRRSAARGGRSCRRPGRRDRHGTAVGAASPMPRPLDRAQVRGVRGERGLQRLGQVLQQVEAVGDLHRLGRAAPGAVGVGAGAVARHDLDPGVLAQPAGEGLRLAVGQQRHRPPPLQVDQHGAVAVALAQRPVVDPEDRGRDLGRRGRRPDQPQQGVARGRHEQGAAQPGAGGAAQREADRRLPAGEARRPARPGRGDARQALGEDAALAARRCRRTGGAPAAGSRRRGRPRAGRPGSARSGCGRGRIVGRTAGSVPCANGVGGSG